MSSYVKQLEKISGGVEVRIKGMRRENKVRRSAGKKRAQN
jgi:hypothetical protein